VTPIASDANSRQFAIGLLRRSGTCGAAEDAEAFDVMLNDLVMQVSDMSITSS
jgi:hypothetical protein